MLRSISTEGFIFWWFNCMAAMFVLCWIVKNIGDFLDNHDKLRKKSFILGAFNPRNYLPLLHV